MRTRFLWSQLASACVECDKTWKLPYMTKFVSMCTIMFLCTKDVVIIIVMLIAINIVIVIVTIISITIIIIISSSIIIIGIIAIVVVIVIMISITIAIIIIAAVFVIVISNIVVVTIISFSRFILNTRICVSGRKFRGRNLSRVWLIFIVVFVSCPFGPHSRLESSAVIFFGGSILSIFALLYIITYIYIFIYLFKYI